MLLVLGPHRNPRRRPFKFENFWLRHDEITPIVLTSWNSITNVSNPAKKIVLKLEAVAKALTIWANGKFANRDTFLARSKFVIQQLDRAEETRPLNEHEFPLRIKIREHIFRLAQLLEQKWKQRSGCQWLKLEDKNTKYFHACANARKNANAIETLLRENGSVIQPVELSTVLRNHFADLLGNAAQNDLPFDLTGRVGPNEAPQLAALDNRITQQEVRDAIMLMPKDKASGLDGFPIEFFQHFWDIVAADITDLIL